ncbi:methyltransferase domain-containing protein [Spiribacter halobius]|uniref:SAM-dependent methyltransferase n=1 Tax=Sediminicurvatus halobius TaxID=2182432 RepID=A0A2U2N0L3_9GAMM|nr:class I SAM-dependent methyltransferase [Spiribacter halobius]PWG62726.1 SAM-dependent methyltransferase [Spiribacter halobius]UEX77395.1 class I SAM-dependent methyltransferase [Spiribacter halobius]
MSQSSTYAANDGAAYEGFIGRWSRRVAERISGAAEPLPAGPLLDVGCGTGSMALALAERYPERDVIGVDVAEDYLRFARERADAGNVQFMRQNACTLDLESDRFAASFALIVLNFVAEPEAAVAEMRRVTKPGGTVVASAWDFRGGLVYQRLLWDSAAGIDPEAAALRDRIFSSPLALPDGMPRLLEGAGLESVQRSWVTIRMDFLNFDDYWQPLLGGQGPVGGYVAGLEPALRERVCAAVRSAYLSGDEDGPRSLTATAWVVTGRVPPG